MALHSQNVCQAAYPLIVWPNIQQSHLFE
uniref:Uncharacterized protein n=1 Tax=Arundo donax TaxID=35708 RepID=A0A0A9AYH2_ARUDO